MAEEAANTSSDGTPATGTAKQRRQERARARQAIQADFKKAKEKVAAIEKRCNELSDRKTVIVAQLASGAKVDFARLKRELAEVEKELGSIDTQWEEAALELESLRQANDRINSNCPPPPLPFFVQEQMQTLIPAESGSNAAR